MVTHVKYGPPCAPCENARLSPPRKEDLFCRFCGAPIADVVEVATRLRLRVDPAIEFDPKEV